MIWETLVASRTLYLYLITNALPVQTHVIHVDTQSTCNTLWFSKMLLKASVSRSPLPPGALFSSTPALFPSPFENPISSSITDLPRFCLKTETLHPQPLLFKPKHFEHTKKNRTADYSPAKSHSCNKTALLLHSSHQLLPDRQQWETTQLPTATEAGRVSQFHIQCRNTICAGIEVKRNTCKTCLGTSPFWQTLLILALLQ